MKITLDMLQGACEDQLAVFAREWPDGADVTRQNLERAVALGLDISWAAEHLLTDPALKVYYEARASAWKVYNEAMAPALKVYNEAAAPTFILAWDNGNGAKKAEVCR